MLVVAGMICTMSLTLLVAKIMFFMLSDVYNQVHKKTRNTCKKRKIYYTEEDKVKKVVY